MPGVCICGVGDGGGRGGLGWKVKIGCISREEFGGWLRQVRE